MQPVTVKQSIPKKDEFFDEFKAKFEEINTLLRKKTETTGVHRALGFWTGDYKLAPINFEKFKVTHMPWSNFSGLNFGMAGCGPCLLGQLTGANPWEISDLMAEFMPEYCSRPGNEQLDTKKMLTGAYTPTEFMITFLSLYNITTYPITIRDVCPSKRIIDTHITKNHVLLVAMHVAKDEKTWCIVYQDKLWHTTEVNPLSMLEFINNPISEAYVLFNPAWKTGYFSKPQVLEIDEAMINQLQEETS